MTATPLARRDAPEPGDADRRAREGPITTQPEMRPIGTIRVGEAIHDELVGERIEELPEDAHPSPFASASHPSSASVRAATVKTIAAQKQAVCVP